MPASNAGAILQVKVWLTGISSMVWRRILVPTAFTLCELHGVLQVAMGWEGIHLYGFHLRAKRYDSWDCPHRRRRTSRWRRCDCAKVCGSSTITT